MKMNLSFSDRLNLVLNEIDNKRSLYTPDDIYHYHDAGDGEGDDRIAFIYNKDGSIFYGDKNDTHDEIALYNGSEYFFNALDQYDSIRDSLRNEALLGRCGTMEDDDGNVDHYVTFWNTNTKLYDELLEPCLRQLEQDNHITNNTLLSIPFHDVIRVGDTKKQVRTELNDEQKEKIELLRQLHLMRPEQKKAAMLKLGLSPYGAKHKWQKGSEDVALVKPGQKWWAMTSENKIV